MIDKDKMFRLAKLHRHPVYEVTAEVTAIHEAGHNVVQLVTGLKPTKTTVNRKELTGVAKYETYSTECSTPLEEMPIEVQQMGACILAAMYQAGGIAERIFTGTSVEGIVMPYGIDEKASRKILAMVGLPALSQYPDLLAKEILLKHWPMVKKIAHELQINGEIEWDSSPLTQELLLDASQGDLVSPA